MRILVLTQIVDKTDPVLGSFHAWLLEFAQQCEKVTVICLKKGEYDLPNNVQVFSLGKERQMSNVKCWELIIRLAYIYRFHKYILKFRHNYDAVFVHMNPEYVVLGGLFWKLLKKRIVLWYVHRQVTWKLRIAEKLADTIFTIAPESFRLPSRKIKYVGHGVDTEKFSCSQRPQNEVFKIVSVGRITKIKNLDTLLGAARILKESQKSPARLNDFSRSGGEVKRQKFIISIIGGAVTEDDDKYFDGLKKKILKENLGDAVWFKGAISFENMAEMYCESDLSVNLTPTGGIDKAVLESMSCGVPALVSNEAFKPIFGQYADRLIFKFRDAQDLASKISYLMERADPSLPEYLQAEVRKNHSIEKPVKAIIEALRQ